MFYDILVNNRKIRAFLDTGSTLTAISSAAARRLRLSPDSRTAITIRHVGGHEKTLGRIEPFLQIAGQTHRFPVHVLDKLSHDALIGIDAARAFGLKVDFSGRQAYNHNRQPFISNISRVTEDSLETVRIPDEAIDITDNGLEENMSAEATNGNSVINTTEIDPFIRRQHEIKSYNSERQRQSMDSFLFTTEA